MRSPFVMPSSGQNGLRRLVTFTSRGGSSLAKRMRASLRSVGMSTARGRRSDLTRSGATGSTIGLAMRRAVCLLLLLAVSPARAEEAATGAGASAPEAWKGFFYRAPGSTAVVQIADLD